MWWFEVQLWKAQRKWKKLQGQGLSLWLWLTLLWWLSFVLLLLSEGQ